MNKAKTSRSTSKTKSNKNTITTINTKKNSTTKIKKADTIPRARSKSVDKKPDIDPSTLTKNIEIINKLITNSQSIVELQDDILKKYTELSNRVKNDNKPLTTDENNEFFEFLEKYSVNLNNILTKLKKKSDESNKIKCYIC
jgi:hypothetical protein